MESRGLDNENCITMNPLSRSERGFLYNMVLRYLLKMQKMFLEQIWISMKLDKVGENSYNDICMILKEEDTPCPMVFRICRKLSETS